MRSAVPLGHKLIALLVAAAAACGLYAFLRYREAQLASAASLSFDASEARQLDPGLAQAAHPAVVFGESILTDSVIARLLPQTDLAGSSSGFATGEFRNRVELSQPTAGLLYVRYRDSDPGQAASAANAVAEALAAWTPSGSGAPPPAAVAPPAPQPTRKISPKPAPKPAPAAAQNNAAAGPSLAPALGDLSTQLSAAARHTGPDSSLSEHDRQRSLEGQVRDAQQKIRDLRTRFPQPASQATLEAVQHALAVFWPGAAGMSTAGTSGAQLRYEREQLTHALEVIDQQRQRAQAADHSPAAAPAPAPQPNAAPAPEESDLPAQQQQPPAPAASAPPPSLPGDAYNPLHLDRMAGTPAPVLWWPSALVGCFCGLLWWGLAFARYHSSSESDDFYDLPEESGSAYRLITAAAPLAMNPASIAPAPLAPPAEPVSAEPVSAEPVAPHPAPAHPAPAVSDSPAPASAFRSASPAPRTLPETTPYKRASFSFEPAAEPAPRPVSRAEQNPTPAPSLVQPAPLPPAPIRSSFEAAIPVLPENAPLPENPPIAGTSEPPPAPAPLAAPEIVPPETPRAQSEAREIPPPPELNAVALPTGDALNAIPAKPPESVPRFQDKVIGMSDPWADQMRQNISHTTIGRMLDALIMEEERAAAASREQSGEPKEEDAEAQPPHSNRLAG